MGHSIKLPSKTDSQILLSTKKLLFDHTLHPPQKLINKLYFPQNLVTQQIVVKNKNLSCYLFLEATLWNDPHEHNNVDGNGTWFNHAVGINVTYVAPHDHVKARCIL